MTGLHYDLTGPADAPPLILSGSLGSDLRMWNGQLALSDRLRLIRIDHRGHGGSPAPPGPYSIADLATDVLELIDQLGLQRVSYAGLSLGGMIGIWLAANAPERIDRLVLLCTAARMSNADAFAKRAKAVRTASTTEPIADAVIDRWLTPDFAAARPEVRRRLRDMITACDPNGYAACCQAIAVMDLRPALARINVPTLIVSATDDLATPPELQAEIAAGIAGARHELIGPAAHVAAVEQPSQINQLIGAHLR